MTPRLRTASLLAIDEDGRPENVLFGQFFLVGFGFYGVKLAKLYEKVEIQSSC